MDVVFGFLNDTIGVAIYDLIKQVFFLLDNVVYSLIPLLYKMILYLANINLYRNNQTLIALSNRIYILVGVFMLFKLSFSMIRYIADPNSFSDSSKGFTGLIKNVLISLVLLVSVPYIFGLAYEVQEDIITSNVISNFILGTSGDLDLKDFESSAKDVQFVMFSPFFTLNYNAKDEFKTACNPSVNQNADGVVKYPLVNVLGTRDMALGSDGNGSCLVAVANALDNNQNMKAAGVKLTNFFKTSDGDSRDFGSLAPLVVWREENQSVINYTPIVSTIFGGYLVFLLFSFCFDIGGRAIKLLFLQMLSPIAVLSSVDPTESSQNSKLKEWGSECLKTYLSVFLRLAIIFVIIQIVNVITEFIFADGINSQSFSSKALGSPSSFESLFIYIFLVLGGFQAAKSLPGIIEKATGMKMSGELSLNPFKNPIISGAIGFGLGAAGGFAANAYSAAKGVPELVNNYKGGLLKDKKKLEQEKGELDNYQRIFQYRRKAYTAASDAEAKARDAFYQHPNSSVLYDKWEQARAAKAKSENRMRDAAEKVDSQGLAIRAAQEQVAKSRREMLHQAGQGASSILGIATGAASAAARGAIGGEKAGNLSGAIKAAEDARKAVTDAREDRDVRAEMRYSGQQTTGDRILTSLDEFAGVKGGKNYGVGKIDNEIKSLKNELANLNNELRSAADHVTAARQLTINDSSLNSLAESLKTASSPELRQEIINKIDTHISAGGLSAEDLSAINDLKNAFASRDSIQEQAINLQRQISKLENATTKGSGK